jgi:pyrimidine/purine-5'-nucleotide nucleosidase
MNNIKKITITPKGAMDILSQSEIQRITDNGLQPLHETLRRCVLAVLNWGEHTDNASEVLERFKHFEVKLRQTQRGIELELINPPQKAFVDGEIVAGVRELVFSIIRDIVFIHSELIQPLEDGVKQSSPTSLVFQILRHANCLIPHRLPNIIVCWGGHAIKREEYDYAKEVGYQLGLRGFDICTGCGPGAMKAPMKGAAVGHAKQRIHPGRYIGMTEPGIIAAESPNPIVNELIVLPDIEKRLEGFIRTGHGFIVFPGGVGTAEEILYLLGILLHPKNDNIPFPIIWTGPAKSKAYFEQIDAFIGATLGKKAQQYYQIIIDDPLAVAQAVKSGIHEVTEYRKSQNEAFYYNWQLHIDPGFQVPFVPNHENMRSLNLTLEQPAHELAANLRCAFSGMVSGNVKQEGIDAIEQYGPFEITGDKALMQMMDALLNTFVEQGRMKLAAGDYQACYEIVEA